MINHPFSQVDFVRQGGKKKKKILGRVEKHPSVFCCSFSTSRLSSHLRFW